MEPTGLQHLRVYDRIDVLLDVWPWNGHTTACEALWMGVPVVTFRGKSRAGRMTASVLTCLGLNEWVGETVNDYVRISAEMGGERQRRKELRVGLRERMCASVLCEGGRFTRGIEETYREI